MATLIFFNGQLAGTNAEEAAVNISKAQEKEITELFSPTADPREGKDRLTVRFDRENYTVHPATKRRSKRKVGVVLHFKESPAVTPTGGRYTRRGMTVKTPDGRKWYGTMKNGSDIVRLRLAED